MAEHEHDERLAALAERAERGELPVPPGVRIQRASDEGPDGAAELLSSLSAAGCASSPPGYGEERRRRDFRLFSATWRTNAFMGSEYAQRRLHQWAPLFFAAVQQNIKMWLQGVDSCDPALST